MRYTKTGDSTYEVTFEKGDTHPPELLAEIIAREQSITTDAEAATARRVIWAAMAEAALSAKTQKKLRERLLIEHDLDAYAAYMRRQAEAKAERARTEAKAEARRIQAEKEASA